MPQDTLIPTDNRDTGFRLTWREVEGHQGRHWNLTVEIETGHGQWRTIQAQRWTGYMLDLATTLASEATSAFFFDSPKAVGRAVASVAKTARAHARHYDRVGF